MASATFERLTDPLVPAWILRVTIGGIELAEGGVPLDGAVGDVPIVALMPTFEGGLQGFLETEPPAGAVLRLGYLGGELVDTDVTFDPSNV
jgi:hypothetical protein